MTEGPELVSSWIWRGSSTADCLCCLAASSPCQTGWTKLPKTCTFSWRMCMCTLDTQTCIQPPAYVGVRAPSHRFCSIPWPPHPHHPGYMGTCSPLAHLCTVGWTYNKTLAESVLHHSPWHSFLHGDTDHPIISAS